ncbi:phospholipase D-like domain-containing protein [Loktanella sp. DJP18]|uniref:phospholipase D-like domain-containing protein n=1 Tax=Loktanella sp. DJP18 TaxID=3409788 RepID=UPI003BB58872
MPLSWLTTHAEIVLLSALVIAAAAFLLQQRRSPQSTAAWLLFLIVAPYFAIPFFVGLAVRKRANGPEALKLLPVSDQPPACHVDAMLRAYGLPGASDGHAFTLHDTPQSARAALFDLIAGAKHEIDAMFYIVARDDVGRAFVAALTEKARQGVAVRLIIDRLGTLNPPWQSLNALSDAGGEVRFFSPLVQRPMRGHLNLRNHRKIMVVDQSVAFGGGMNIGHEYLGDGPDVWTDLAFTLRGPAVQSCAGVFASDWRGTGGTADDPVIAPPPGDGKTIAQLVPSGPDLRHDGLHDTLINAIHRADTRVWIATPYFLPTDTLSEALSVAGRRGVDVCIMLPRRSNQRIADFARGAYLRELQAARCKILLFKPGMLHAKAGIIDQSAYVGSVNFDVRSMLLNFEDTLFVHDPTSVAQLADWFTGHTPSCDVGIANAGAMRRIGEGLFRIGAPIL